MTTNDPATGQPRPEQSSAATMFGDFAPGLVTVAALTTAGNTEQLND